MNDHAHLAARDRAVQPDRAVDHVPGTALGSPPPSSRLIPSSLRRPLWAVALLGTLAACAATPSAASEATRTPAGATTTSVAPRTSVAPPTSAAISAAPTSSTLETVAPTPTTVVRPSGPVDAFATVGGARMHVHCVGAGAVTVVLIAGFTEGAENWGSIEGPLAQGARVCSPERFGTGTSDPPASRQTFTTQAADLHAALGSIGEPGPYVVVGHSYGGAEAVAFASTFPAEVSGLLLLDASPTTWPANSCAVPDDGSDMAHVFRDICAANANPDSNPERLDVPASFAEISTITSLGALPTTVVTAATHSYPGLDATAATSLNQAWDEGQQRWASLSTVGHVVPVADTGHHIQLDQAAVVIEQIQRLVGGGSADTGPSTTSAEG